jgi:hypothetical protein
MKDESDRSEYDSSFILHPSAFRSGGLPVRPDAGGLDPIILPTPRADAFRARLPAYRGQWTRRQLVAWRRIVLEEILGQMQSNRPV